MKVSDEIAAAMRSNNQRFCDAVIGGRRFDALDQIYTRNARILPPDAAMVEGRAGIKQFWEWAVKAMGMKNCSLASIDMEDCGETAIEIGRATLSLENGQSLSVKYMVHWKQEDGSWRWDKDIWNMG